MRKQRGVRVERAAELADGWGGQGACIGIVPSSPLGLSPRRVVRMRSRTRRRHVPVVLVVGAVAHALSSCLPRRASWSSWHIRHAILVGSRPSSCGRRDLPIARCVEARAYGTRISVIVPSGRAGAAARFAVIVVCPPSSLPLPCQGAVAHTPASCNHGGQCFRAKWLIDSWKT